MKNLSATLLILSMVLSIARGQDPNINIDEFYPVEPSHSYVGFSVKYMGYAMVRGRFADFQGTIRYDENKIENTSVTFRVQTASIDTDQEWRDNDLKSAQWLDTANFPVMMFTGKSVSVRNDGFDITGELTIKNTTKSVTLRMDPPSGLLKDTRGDHQVIFTGSLTIDRTEFGVEGQRWSKVKEGIVGVDSKVNIELSILGKQLQERNLSGWVRNPERPPGKVYQMIKDQGVKKAMNEFAKMVKESDRINVNALRIVGRLLMRQGKLDDALTVYKQNANSFPLAYEPFRDLGEIYCQRKEYDNAKANFMKALEVNPQNTYSKEVLRYLSQ